MARLLMLIAVAGFVVWRRRALEAHDRAHGFGSYAPLLPERRQ